MPNPDGSKTKEELDEEQRLDAEALKRQDPAQTARMQEMAAIEDGRTQRLIDELRANGLEEDANQLALTLSTADPDRAAATPPPPPPPPPRDEEREERRATATPPPPPPPAPNAPPPPPPAPPSGKKAKDVDPQLLAQLSGGNAIPLEALDNLKVTVRIAGEDVEMSVHDLRRSTQLDGAAHKRLEEANRLLSEARTAADNARAGTPPPPAPPVGVDGKARTGDSPPASVTEKVQTLVNALFVGDSEAAAAALTEVLTTGNQAVTVDPAKFAQQVTGHVKQQLSVDEANRQFRSDFPDIVGDRQLARAADDFYVEALAENPKLSYDEALAEAGKRTRQWMASKGVQTATGGAGGTTRQERQERKERVAGQEVQGAHRTTSGQQDERIPSASETIEDMRKMRGLA